MDNQTYLECKRFTSRIYELCLRFWPNEFNEKYTAPRESFRDWLNEKTGLNEDHIVAKHAALKAWLYKLESMIKSG